jgi:alpha-tubulin suppressor-like RCC1 family protein
MGSALPTASLGTGRTATALTAGIHTCALLDNAQIKCWGWNLYGQLGLGDTNSRGDGPGEMGDALPAVALGSGRTATAVAAGLWHTCAILDNGQVKCWGFNGSGQLGLGDTASRGDQSGEMGDNLPVVALGTGRTATAISAGGRHTCVRLDNGQVKCWGDGFHGELGLGDIANRGDQTGEMGDSLPAVSLGTGRTATAISAGDRHTCARLDNGQVKCWGENTAGQLGLGDTAWRGRAAGQMGDSLPAVTLGTGRTATAVSASGGDSMGGNGYTCALLDNAQIKCWGSNDSGRLGLGDTANRGDQSGEMGDSLPIVALATGLTATKMSAGWGGHACAILGNGLIKCWGANGSGQLGLGDTAARGDGANEMGDNLPAVVLW